MKIGKYTFETDLILPAVAGFSDVGMRKLCLSYGAALACTEMISAKGLVYGNENTKDLLAASGAETLKYVQLFGREPHIVARAIQSQALAKFDLIDLNFGCPVPKIVKNGEGSALLKEPSLIHALVKEAVKAAEGRPVTAKIRVGFKKDAVNADVVARAIEDGGAAAVTVHGRTADMFYQGKADWQVIARVKQAVKIPVIGNGDVTDRKSYLEMMSLTGADGAAVARGALGRPFVFAEIRGVPYGGAGEESFNAFILNLIKEHARELTAHFRPQTVASNMKKHVAAYLKNIAGSKKIKNAVFLAKDLEEMFARLEGVRSL
jgi:nifR3 family TIM-barrel protein